MQIISLILENLRLVGPAHQLAFAKGEQSAFAVELLPQRPFLFDDMLCRSCTVMRFACKNLSPCLNVLAMLSVYFTRA